MMDSQLVTNLSDFGKVLFADASELSRVRAFGQEARLEVLTRRLRSPQRRSLLLVGPSGVGKTAIDPRTGTRQAQSWPEPIVVPGNHDIVAAGRALALTWASWKLASRD